MHIRKSASGTLALEQRNIKLSSLARRLLILIDGQRHHAEPQTLMGSNAIEPLLEELLAHDCIEAEEMRAIPAPLVATPDTSPEALPERSAKQLVMGRHFMINTLSSFCGPFALRPDGRRIEGARPSQSQASCSRMARRVGGAGARQTLGVVAGRVAACDLNGRGRDCS